MAERGATRRGKTVGSIYNEISFREVGRVHGRMTINAIDEDVFGRDDPV